MQWSLFLLILMGQCSFFTCQLYEYHFINESKTWYDAQTYCKDHYTDLAIVPNMSSMERLLQSEQNHTEAWIGLHNMSGYPGKWLWCLPEVELNDTELQWFENEPEENCVTMNSTDPLWGHTHPCAQNYTFICYSEQNETGKNFHLIQERKMWQEAQSFCRENYTDLVSGLEQIQDPEFQSLMKTVNESVWIGLFRDTWMWKNCSFAMLNESGKWGSDDCNQTKPFFCYHDKLVLIEEKKTWEDTLEYCRVNHCDLVSITELDDQIWVQQRAKMANTSHVWLGLRYSCPLDLWFWVSDKLVCYENWASEKHTDEECDVAVAMGRSGQWYKRNENEKLNFFCSSW